MKNRIKYALIMLGAGILVNIGLSLAKLYVGLSSNSLTIMLDSINNFFDILTCFVTVLAFVILLRPKTPKAPLGYGRSEYLAGFVVAVASVVVGGLFFVRSLNRFAMPEPIWFGVESCATVAAGIVIKLAMGLTYYFVNKKSLHSKAIKAIALDSFLDTAVGTASLISFLVSTYVDYALDAIFGMAVSVAIIVFAAKMVWDNIKSVIVGDAPEKLKEKATEEAIQIACVRQVKEVLVHDYGYGVKVVTVRAAFDEGTTTEQIEEAKRRLEDKFAESEECPPQIDLSPILQEEKAEDANAPAAHGDDANVDINDGL